MADATPQGILARLFRRHVTMPQQPSTANNGNAAQAVAAVTGGMGFGGAPQQLHEPAKLRYDTYRAMREVPTIAFARHLVRIPIESGQWSLEGDPEPVDFVQSVLEPLWHELLADILFGIDYGWSSFELVWEFDPDWEGKARVILSRPKALVPDKTEILLDESGTFAGLKQGKATVPAEKALLWTYDRECDNLYGRSRLENIRTHVYPAWLQAHSRKSQYEGKVAGVTPLIEYPEGKSLDATGSEVSNFDLAKAVLANLGRGNGVAMPNAMAKNWRELSSLGGAAKEMLKAWHIDFLEPNGDHGSGFVASLDYEDKLVLRGMLIPERAALEGTNGTKAEAETHGDWAKLSAQGLFLNILETLNVQVVDRLTVYNFGPAAEGTVRLKSAGLDPGSMALLNKLVLAVYGAPANADLAFSALDMGRVLDLTGLPARDEIDISAGDDALGQQRSLRPDESLSAPSGDQATQDDTNNE